MRITAACAVRWRRGPVYQLTAFELDQPRKLCNTANTEEDRREEGVSQDSGGNGVGSVSGCNLDDLKLPWERRRRTFHEKVWKSEPTWPLNEKVSTLHQR